MRIVVGKMPGEVKIFTDDGVDITTELCCSEIAIFVTPEGATATLTCEHVEFNADLDYDNLVAQVRVRTVRE